MNRGVLIVSNRPISALEAVLHTEHARKIGMDIVVIRPVGSGPYVSVRTQFLTEVGRLWSRYFDDLN